MLETYSIMHLSFDFVEGQKSNKLSIIAQLYPKENFID